MKKWKTTKALPLCHHRCPQPSFSSTFGLDAVLLHKPKKKELRKMNIHQITRSHSALSSPSRLPLSFFALSWKNFIHTLLVFFLVLFPCSFSLSLVNSRNLLESKAKTFSYTIQRKTNQYARAFLEVKSPPSVPAPSLPSFYGFVLATEISRLRLRSQHTSDRVHQSQQD